MRVYVGLIQQEYTGVSVRLPVLLLLLLPSVAVAVATLSGPEPTDKVM